MAAIEQCSSVLKQAINDADKATLQKVLLSMCESSPECLAAASEQLLVPKGDLTSSDEDGGQGEAENSEPKSKKRKTLKRKGDDTDLTSRYETCWVCEKSFDVTTNTDTSCRTHEGELEMNHDAFLEDDDRDPNQYFDPETSSLVEESPGEFTWTCCNKDGAGSPCVIQAHELEKD